MQAEMLRRAAGLTAPQAGAGRALDPTRQTDAQ
jgi:hypothetical protein